MATYSVTATFNETFFPTVQQKPTPEIIQRAAVMAYNYINGRLDGIYPVPFTSVPGLILDISDLLTKCIARALVAGNTPAIPKNVKRDGATTDCGMAVLMLDDVANIKVGIGISPLPGATGTTERTGSTVFDIDDPINHQPSQHVIDQIESERQT